jgi:predicted DNA-binding transcriptional regulator AlpA
MKFLADTEVAALLKVDRATLRRWRERNTGPSYLRIGPKLIRYEQEALNRWVGACQVRTIILALGETEVGTQAPL